MDSQPQEVKSKPAPARAAPVQRAPARAAPPMKPVKSESPVRPEPERPAAPQNNDLPPTEPVIK